MKMKWKKESVLCLQQTSTELHRHNAPTLFYHLGFFLYLKTKKKDFVLYGLIFSLFIHPTTEL